MEIVIGKINEQIANFLTTVSEDEQDIEICVDFVNQLIRLRSETPPPLIEMITIIKHEKPRLYGHLKKRLSTQQYLSMLFQIDLPYEQARVKIFSLLH